MSNRPADHIGARHLSLPAPTTRTLTFLRRRRLVSTTASSHLGGLTDPHQISRRRRPYNGARETTSAGAREKTVAENYADTQIGQEKTLLAQTIQNENAVMGQRLIWTLTLQGFLFASYFFTGSDQVERVKYVLPLLGGATAVSSLLGTIFAHIALTRAMGAFERLQKREGIESVHPGTSFPFILTLLTPHFFLPISLICVWAFVFATNHLGLQLPGGPI